VYFLILIKFLHQKLEFCYKYYPYYFLLFVIFNDLRITDLRIGLFNELLDIKYVSIIFTVFCLLILLNGSNFLDGLNTLVIGYYILVSGILILVSAQFNLLLNDNVFYFF